MTNKNIFKKITIVVIIISLFFTFSFLVGFNDNRADTTYRLNDESILLDDGEENGNGDENGSEKGLNIEELISLVQEATSKHFAILQEVLENAPGPAKKGIEWAIAVSIRGSIRAIEALSKIKPSNKNNKDNGQKTFHIIASCNRGGTIEPKGIQFSQGESVAFEIIADEEYTLVWVRVDNKKLEGISPYSFDDIDSNHTIHAHFKKIKNSSNQNDDVD
ncbi:hypothetical protein ES705_00234 [subsurface metagenome]|jgi:hypothetical protein|nr:hypothetical protein [Clostridia bacterium]TET10769.1 MAG: hypothetical protein E3J83_00115 [Candidatus Atribacteria bacterium]